MRRRSGNTAFTLVEALVSMAIMAAMLLALATVFRQTSRLSGQVRGGAAAFQAARQIFEGIGRDLAGVTRDGFLFIRTQELQVKSGNLRTGLILFYDEEGNPVRVNDGRFDVMVMTTAGYHTSSVDAARTANFARVLWAQSERASGNNLPEVPDTPKFWGVNMVLCRHQTLMLPDRRSCDESNSSYGGDNRGPDYFNMAISDLTRFFGPAMGVGGEDNLPTYGENYGLFSTFYGEGTQELTPYRRSSKVWRFGRSGPGESGESPASEGAGDLTRHQVNIEETVPGGMFTSSYAPQIQSGYTRQDCIRGHERPKVFGPKDYYRIAAFGVAQFRVDWSDGRRVAVRNSNGDWVGTRLQFYPENKLGSYSRLYTDLMGPGEKRTYCWNRLSPTCIRDTALRKAFGGVTYDSRYKDWYSSKPSNWQEINDYTHNAFGGSCSYGGGGLGDGGWPWPRAIRVRLLIYDSTRDPPIGYLFEQIFHVLVQ